jgi:hypothetical protein
MLLRYKNHISISIIILAVLLVVYIVFSDTTPNIHKTHNLQHDVLHTASHTISTEDSKDTTTKNIQNTTLTTTQTKARSAQKNTQQIIQQNTQYTNKELPPNFPAPIAPLDTQELQEMETLMQQADEIIASMDTILNEVELPELTPQEIQELNTQRNIELLEIEKLQQQLQQLESNQ